MSYKLRIYFDDGDTELVDEEFETEADAEEEFVEWSSNYSAGRDVLELADEDYSDAEIIGCDIFED